MFIALEYSCGFPNASDLIRHLPHKKNLLPCILLHCERCSFPSFGEGSWNLTMVPRSCFLAGEEPCLVPQQAGIAQEDSPW